MIEEGDVAYTYVIIDDYNDMLFQQQEHFVYIDSRIGLTQADINKAKSKYHAVLSAAAVSKVPVHAAVIMTEEGDSIKHESYTHPAEQGGDE